MAPSEHKTGSASSAYRAYLERLHFANLDGLRFICIAMVLWHHSPITASSGDEFQILTRGFMGVDFFFVLSGYLITTLLLREIDRFGNFSIKQFYQRRLIRIVPVYFFVVTAIGAYYIFVKGQTQYLELWPYYYLFLSNFLTEHIPLLTITWSLSVEEQYYMIWPLLLLLLPVRYLWIVCVVLIAVNVAAISGLFGSNPWQAGPLIFVLPAATYAPIIMGSLAALLLHRQGAFIVFYRGLSGYGTALFVFVAMVMALHFTPEDVRGWPNLLIHTLMTLLLIALLVREDTILSPILQNSVLARIGVVSYGIYLYHLLALDLVVRVANGFSFVLPDWAVTVLYCCLGYLLAEISFCTLEAWFRRFRPKPRRPNADAALSAR